MEKFTARDYQKYAIRQIIDKPFLSLMLDMGLGKTVITLTAIEQLLYDSFTVNKVLIVAPLRVAESTWSDEVDKWEHLQGTRIIQILGDVKKREAALQENAYVYTINRENVPWLVKRLGKHWDFDMLVIDESSSFKNHQSQRFKALCKIRDKVKRIVELTGTPTPNGLMDLWSQIFLLDGGERLGKRIGDYRMRYFKPAYGNGYVTYAWTPLPHAQENIENIISDICVSMKSEDYLKLPPMIYNRVKVHLPNVAAKRYKELEKEYILSLQESEIVASNAATLTGKLLQMSNGACYDDKGGIVKIHDEKLKALENLAELNEHKTLLVFYWFKHDLERLKQCFPKARQLKGKEDITDWNAGKIEMLLVHPASAGHGLNLQYGGSIIVWFGLSWSLELYQQANKRLHRSGQRDTVIIHHLIAEGTIDEQVMKALSDKKVTQDSILNAIKARISLYK